MLTHLAREIRKFHAALASLQILVVRILLPELLKLKSKFQQTMTMSSNKLIPQDIWVVRIIKGSIQRAPLNMFYVLYYFFVGGRTGWLFLFINNFTLSNGNTSRDWSSSYNRIEMIFNKGFEGNPVTLSFFTSSMGLLLVILTSSINILVIYLQINTISKLDIIILL